MYSVLDCAGFFWLIRIWTWTNSISPFTAKSSLSSPFSVTVPRVRGFGFLLFLTKLVVKWSHHWLQWQYFIFLSSTFVETNIADAAVATFVCTWRTRAWLMDNIILVSVPLFLQLNGDYESDSVGSAEIRHVSRETWPDVLQSRQRWIIQVVSL